ncbi:hypothetical protein IW143_003664 [Coemansia sp. RSA 520]|nr:hypothetical protein IW143_003664 [Coemansia sp. RSA 520]KAJ2266689.1 hypothetical protein J3F81_005377 [Coemansia sp. RSA 371]KAJ2426928.1 hypothetical protein IWW41_003979 [Coemansia sp. RSA 2522]
MKVLASVFAVVALFSLQASANSKCHPSGCYSDWVNHPSCVEEQPCPAIAYQATVCPWDCGKELPANCSERCRPCKAEVCPEICICEKVCIKK